MTQWATALSRPALTIWLRPGTWCGSMRRSIPTSKWPRSSGGVTRPAGRRALSPPPTGVPFPPAPKGCAFPLVSNLFGSIERLRYMFRDALDDVRQLVELKVDPGRVGRRPWRYLGAARAAFDARPRVVRLRRVSRAPVLAHETSID